MEILQPEGWPRPSGYANGAGASGRVICVAGQVGWNAVTGHFESDDFAIQVRQSLRNVITVLEAGGASARDVVRLTWFVTDKAAYVAARSEIGRSFRELFAAHFPAMSVVFVASLLEDRALVEIEATAVVQE